MTTTAFSPKEREAFITDPKNHATAKDIQMNAAPEAISIRIDEKDMPQPRPDLAGLRVTGLNGGAVYVINPEGLLQWIPNGDTYNNLFNNWEGILKMDIINIARGAQITDGAILAKSNTGNAVYLVSNGRKRLIASPAVMGKYNFNWSRIFGSPAVLIDFIPEGPVWH